MLRNRAAGSGGITDPLFGSIELLPPIARLAATPAVQRLRRVRLSNIDSLDAPGIAGVTRFEHVVGTSYLAHRVGFWGRLSEDDRVTLAAAALLHDIAITPFGHLLEEALRYAGQQYAHEEKMAALLRGEQPHELGGIDLQLFDGAEAGISEWARAVFGADARSRLEAMFEAICGRGRFGPCISGAIDLDNIDNVVRVAYHMGLTASSDLAPDLAGLLVGSDAGGPIWSVRAPDLVAEWLTLREALYTQLMLARQDFIGKTMMTVAIIQALQTGQLWARGYEWALTDDQLLARLNPDAELLAFLRDAQAPGAHDPQLLRIRATVRDWQLGRLWTASPFSWVDGEIPARERVWAFGHECARVLDRPCFAHGIPDKRHRRVVLRLEDGTERHLGQSSKRWLFAVVSPSRTPFTTREADATAALAREYFGCEVSRVESAPSPRSAPPTLFDVE